MKGGIEDSVVEQNSAHFMEHVRQVCSFAKIVPGFKRLAHEDQVTLLKACIFEILLVRMSSHFDSQVRKCLTCNIWHYDLSPNPNLPNQVHLMQVRQLQRARTQPRRVRLAPAHRLG